MMTLPMDRIRELDAQQGVRSLRRDLRLSTIFHDDNLALISEEASNLGLTARELASYIWLQTYLDDLAWSYGDVPSLEEVAQQFGFTLGELEDYLQERASQEIDEDLEEMQNYVGLLSD